MNTKRVGPNISHQLNRERILGALDHDRALVQAIIQIYLEDYTALLDELWSASKLSQLEQIGLAAHKLKGLVSNLYADKLVDDLDSLENSARGGAISDAPGKITTIRAHCDALAAELRQWDLR